MFIKHRMKTSIHFLLYTLGQPIHTLPILNFFYIKLLKYEITLLGWCCFDDFHCQTKMWSDIRKTMWHWLKQRNRKNVRHAWLVSFDWLAASLACMPAFNWHPSSSQNSKVEAPEQLLWGHLWYHACGAWYHWNVTCRRTSCSVGANFTFFAGDKQVVI
jgi:hypothetical protein